MREWFPAAGHMRLGEKKIAHLPRVAARARGIERELGTQRRHHAGHDRGGGAGAIIGFAVPECLGAKKMAISQQIGFFVTQCPRPLCRIACQCAGHVHGPHGQNVGMRISAVYGEPGAEAVAG